jgi:protein-S-isoprenylcysteine O-methyltransferase Ste14
LTVPTSWCRSHLVTLPTAAYGDPGGRLGRAAHAPVAGTAPSECEPTRAGAEGVVMRPKHATRRSQREPGGGKSRYTRWAQREHSEATRIRTTLLAGLVFLGLLPILVAGVGPRLDRRLGLRPLRTRNVNGIVGGLLTVVGFTLGFWSISTQLTRGRGTPLPVMPTQELLTEGPFRYCRNPMTLGTVLAYLGMAVARGTIAGTVLVLSLAASLLAYLKRLEEGELAERFGEDYLAYKRETPFIIPRLPGRR